MPARTPFRSLPPGHMLVTRRFAPTRCPGPGSLAPSFPPNSLREACTMTSMRLRRLAISAASAALLTTAAAVASAQGTLTGTVTTQPGGTPLQEARILILGTSRVGSSGPDGKYSIPGVPAGTAEIRVIRVGYQEQKKSVRILDGQKAVLDFAMSTTVVQLQEVVTTATGEQRRVEVGNAVENLCGRQAHRDARRSARSPTC